jgi:hypothetical protein
MGTDRFVFILIAGALLLAGCGEQRTDLPTSPASPTFAAKKTDCNTTLIQQLVNDEFTGSTRVAVNKVVNGLSQYRAAGDSSSATYLGYTVLDSIARVGRLQGTPSAGSRLAVQVFRCMSIGSATIPDSFTIALDDHGAFAVRGWPVADAAAVAAEPVVAEDGAWQLQPPGTATWNDIVALGVANLADSVAQLFLAYGRPGSTAGFSNDALTSTVFDWSTIPIATFSPAVLIAQCSQPTGYIQHNPIASAEILGYVAVSCGATSQLERRPASFAERLLRLFQPEPLQATALAIGSAGSRRTLSPFGKIDPVEINLLFASQPNKSGNSMNRYLSPTVTVTAKSKGGVGIGGSAFVWIEAYNNSGVFVKVCNNWAYTDATGLASFPHAYLNKAGGYTLVAKAATAAGAPAVPLKAAVTTALFNVKNSTAPPPDNGCAGSNVYTSGPLPPPPGPPPITP